MESLRDVREVVLLTGWRKTCNDLTVQKHIKPIFASVKAFFRHLVPARRKETPEQAILRAFNESYPKWIRSGVLKRPN